MDKPAEQTAGHQARIPSSTAPVVTGGARISILNFLRKPSEKQVIREI
jgi:hypothetical protein